MGARHAGPAAALMMRRGRSSRLRLRAARDARAREERVSFGEPSLPRACVAGCGRWRCTRARARASLARRARSGSPSFF